MRNHRDPYGKSCLDDGWRQHVVRTTHGQLLAILEHDDTVGKLRGKIELV